MRIVFVENSVHSCMESLMAEFSGHEYIEFLHVPPEDETAVAGKGYGEGQMIAAALERSSTLAGSRYFMKVTGRYIIHNIGRLVAIAECALREQRFDFMFRPYEPYPGCIQTFFFVSGIEYWRAELSSLYLKVDDVQGEAYEAVLGRRVLQGSNQKWVIGRLPVPPLLFRAGSDGGAGLPCSREIAIGMLKSRMAQMFKSIPRVERVVM